MTNYHKRMTTFFVRTALIQFAVATWGYFAIGNLADPFPISVLVGIALLFIQILLDTSKAADNHAN